MTQKSRSRTGLNTDPGWNDYRLGLLILIGSGMAALGHEVLWTRRLIDLLGASTESSARVFECFFLGLSLGSATISVFLRRVRRPWFFLAIVETGVAILSIPALALPDWTGWIWPSLGAAKLVTWQGSALKAVLSLVILVPPTFLMGMTLPVLVSTVVSGKPNPSRREILFYAANTFGGVFGVGVVVLLCLQWLGASGSMMLMAGVNLLVATLCFLRHRRGGAAFEDQKPDRATGRVPIQRPTKTDLLPLGVSFFSGAGVLALEILGLALTNLSAPLSIYPQGSILACVILVLALASLIVAKARPRASGSSGLLWSALVAAGVSATIIPLIFLHLPGVDKGLFGYGRSFEQFLARLTGDTLLSLGPAVLFAGMVFPALLSWPSSPQQNPGARLGLLLAVNGMGGVAGAEVAYRILLPSFAVHVSMGVVGVCYGLASLGLLILTREKRRVRYGWSLGALLGSCYLTSTALLALPVYYQSDMYKVVDLRVGREGSLAVVEDGRSRVMILDNQYTLGGTWVTPSLRRQSHLPLLLHPSPRKVGFIGLGTGITASGALEHKAVESITAIELSPIVEAAAARDFDQFNHGICHNPKARIYVEDARIYLESSRNSFDVIIGDLFTPWRPGESSLSSFEEFRAAREALRSGGIFCQWIEMTQWTPQQFQIAAATFRRVFGHLYLFRTSFQTGAVPIGLLGFRDGKPDWSVVAQRCRYEATEGSLQDPLCRHPEGVAMLYLGEFIPPEATPINTLNNLRLELSASRQVVLIDSGTHFSGTGQNWLNLLGGQAIGLSQSESMPTLLRGYPEIGVLATQFEIAVENGSGDAKSLAEKLTEEIPSSIRTDPKADWSLWAGTEPPWTFLGRTGVNKP